VILVAIAATDLDASVAFYRSVFGWPLVTVWPELASAGLASGPVVTIRGAFGGDGRRGRRGAFTPWQAPMMGV
jgi:catechol 2,3-dioxygenase-like lactoylglutathione lyase family enzyme